MKLPSQNMSGHILQAFIRRAGDQLYESSQKIKAYIPSSLMGTTRQTTSGNRDEGNLPERNDGTALGSARKTEKAASQLSLKQNWRKLVKQPDLSRKLKIIIMIIITIIKRKPRSITGLCPKQASILFKCLTGHRT